MSHDAYGEILLGSREAIRRSYDQWRHQAVDLDLLPGAPPPPRHQQTTIARPVSAQGPGTFFGRHLRTLTLEPTELEGWWIERSDLPECLPVRVSVRNVWTTGDIVSNIVLRAGPPQNYIRMVEHIVALRRGLEVDNLLIRMDSGDPPLFNRGSLDLVEALDAAGRRALARPVRYLTVDHTVTVGGPHGSFVTLAPCLTREPRLTMDCAIDFPTAIGKQRLRFPVTPELFREGAVARTNTSALKMLYCRTVGKLFADVRNLGYTWENIQIAGRHRYYNQPRLVHNGKSLEAVWHRAALDLLAALALVEEGLFVGEVVSYKAGHALDVQLITQLYKRGLLRDL